MSARHGGGRHRRTRIVDRRTIGWRSVAAAIVSLGVTAVTIVALSSPAGAAQPLARASLRDAAGAYVGEVVFKGQGKYADRVEVDIDAPTAPNLGDFHGLHIHTVGTCIAPSFGSAGGHWPDGVMHPNHAGDLPSVLLTPSGQAYSEFETARFDVASLFDVDGSAVVLHAGRDNFANIPTRSPYPTAPDATTLSTGDAGARYACGVVESTQS